MDWDLGLQGIAVLIGLSVGFGFIAQLLFWDRSTWWVGLLAAAVYFVAGLLISEVWFGWATAEDLQPNINGLSFDEVLLIGYSIGIPVLLVAKFVTRRVGHQRLAH